MSKIVFAGGPGVGKTTVLLALQARGYAIVGDSARTIIQARRQLGLSPRPPAYEFAQEVLRMDVENYARHAEMSGHVFFDRGVVDAMAMINQVAPLNECELNEWLLKYPYHPQVFVFPPWRAIYTNDSERDHMFEHVEAVHSDVLAWYARCQYRIIEVPRVSVSERCAYMLQALENCGAHPFQ